MREVVGRSRAKWWAQVREIAIQKSHLARNFPHFARNFPHFARNFPHFAGHRQVCQYQPWDWL